MKMLLLCFLTATCASLKSPETIPSYLIGNFEDDYGIEYSISTSEWIQTPGIRLEIFEVDSVQMMLLGYNPIDSTYTRIDYMQFHDQAEFTWGYCYTSYDQKDKKAVLSQEPADTKFPRKGCNGFPFSRMKVQVGPK